jgi:hypothetical protein
MTITRYGTSGMHREDGVFVLYGEFERVVAERDALLAESARLDFMLANDAFTVRCNRDGSILQYQLMTQDEDENYHVLHDEHRFYNTERDAIDAAIEAEKA